MLNLIMVSKTPSSAIKAARATDPCHTPELSSILAKAFSHDPLHHIECPDENSIETMRRQTERDMQSIITETGPCNASIWTATDSLTGQILGFSWWTRNLYADKPIPNEHAPPVHSAVESYANLSAIKKATLMGSGPFYCKYIHSFIQPTSRSRSDSFLFTPRPADACCRPTGTKGRYRIYASQFLLQSGGQTTYILGSKLFGDAILSETWV